MADNDFFSLGFDNALNFDFQMPSVESFQYAPPEPTYDFGYSQPLAFDFQPSAFELQGPVWDANEWARQTAAQEQGQGLYGTNRYQTLEDPLAGARQGAQITHYDPSSRTYFDSTGNPVQPQGGGPVGGPQTPGGQISDVQAGTGLRYDPITNSYLNAAGEAANAQPGSAVSGAAGPQAGAGAGFAQPGGIRPGGQQPGGGGWLDTVNNLLKSPLGGLLGAAGVGAAGLGIARGLAGPVPKTPNPQLAPGSPINAAGQQAMAQFYADQANREAGYQAEQAPGYQGIRNQAMTLIPGQLNPVTVDNYRDPVQQQMQAELLATLRPGATNPMVEDQIQRDYSTLQNTMFRRLGPDWELSSAGQEALQKFNTNANIARFEGRNRTVTALAPGEGQRQQFGYQAPVEKARALGGEQRAYVDTLARTSALGRMDPAGIQAGLGGNPDTYRALQTQLTAQGQAAGYGAANQERRDTMAGVGGLAGTIAGQVGGLSRPRWDTWGQPPTPTAAG